MTGVLPGALPGPARVARKRKADVLALLEQGRHAWVATAGPDGPHLVPLGYAWDGARLVMATHAGHRTVRNLSQCRRARVSLGSATDVVVVDGEVTIVGQADLPASFEPVLDRLPMDPRHGEGRVFLVLTPSRIQAWRHRGELAERTVMTGGRWVA